MTAKRHREPWVPVVCAAECPPCECCGEPFCETHYMHYHDCPCPGPTQDDLLEYKTIKGRLFARWRKET